jgi:DNA-binding CsgD family transcriptional regulator
VFLDSLWEGQHPRLGFVLLSVAISGTMRNWTESRLLTATWSYVRCPGERHIVLEPALSENALRVLREADRRLRGVRRGDRPSVYRICRISMTALASVDAFYIALISDATTNVFPYTFDRGEYIDPDILPYRPGGLTHWIKSSKRTYRWSDDAGALLGRGVPFGAEADLSRDALVTPLVDPVSDDVIGLMSVQSYLPGVFTPEHEFALEWLALAAMLTIARDEEDRDRARLYAVFPEIDTAAITNLADLVGHIWVRIGDIRNAIAEVAARREGAVDPELRGALTRLIEMCEDLQIETADASRITERRDDSAWPILTPREEEVVQLIAQDRSNREIARALHLSEKTVKAHVTSILRKFNATQRSAVAWHVRARQADEGPAAPPAAT